MSTSPSTSQEVILKRIRELPALPEVVNRILAIINQPNTPASEIAKLISYDPGLTSKVLRMVNSAAYGFQRQISSIQHAIMILGFNNVRGLVLSASIFKLFKGQAHPGGLNHQEFWSHCLHTAVAARFLAQKLYIAENEDVFSAALLHDIGKVVLDVYFQQDYIPLLQTARLKNIPCHGPRFFQLEQTLLGVDHAAIGSFLATKWKLPINITSVILHHHAPQQAENCQALVYVVALANAITASVGTQTDAEAALETITIPADVLNYFDLGLEEVMALLPDLQAEFSTTEELLRSFS